MPTSGTHITVVEQVALRNARLRLLLGDPRADLDTPAGETMRWAKLGAIGPDVFYMLGDFNGVPATALQDLENLLVKLGGTYACIGDLSERVNKWLTGELDQITGGVASELQRTSALLSGVVVNGFLSLLVDCGVNVWAAFRSPRQQDLDRKHWFWADYLHYVYSGEFAKHLLLSAKKSGDPHLQAYALGYLTHYVTDVAGHPYVNQVVQGPFRMHWQRHHLVENFLDAYVWDRWHVQQPDPGGSEERPLDAPAFAPNALGYGAAATQSRLHDHIDVGSRGLGDPVDAVIQSVVRQIDQGLFDIGVLESTDMPSPNDPAFLRWCDFLAKELTAFYGPRIHPVILDAPPDPRPGGFPRPDDVAGAYGVLRLLLKISTEEDVEPPVFPDIAGDIASVIDQTMQDVANDIGGIPPFPTPNTSGSFSLDALLQAIADTAQWVAEVAEHVGEAIADVVAGLAAGAATAVTDGIKALLWLLNSALYAMYRYFRDTLVLNAYATPFTEELAATIGPVAATDLWVTKGNLPAAAYPAEEDPVARKNFRSSYRPFVPPAGARRVELPPVQFAAPYLAGQRPEAFLEAGIGQDMLSIAGPQAQAHAPAPPNEATFTASPKSFGGAIANSARVIQLFERVGADLVLPNYDLDADRGYAWPGWQTENHLDPDPGDTGQVTRAIHVNAVPVAG